MAERRVLLEEQRTLATGISLCLAACARELADAPPAPFIAAVTFARELVSTADDLLDEDAEVGAASGRSAPRTLRLGDLLSEVVGEARHVATRHALRFDLPRDLPEVTLDVDRASRVLRNMLWTAVQRAQPGAALEISARASGEHEALSVTVEFEGVKDAPLDHPAAAELATERLARCSAQALGGRIQVMQTGVRGRTRYVLTLPASPDGPRLRG